MSNAQAATKEQVEDSELSTANCLDLGEVMDGTGIEDIQKSVAEFKDQLKLAEKNGSNAKAEGLREKINQCEHYLSEALTPRGRFRKLSTVGKKARDQVSNAVGRTMEVIEKKSTALYNHLERSITTGVRCSYKPESDMTWQL